MSIPYVLHFEVFGDTLHFRPRAAQFALDEQELMGSNDLPPIRELLSQIRPTTYSFCLNLIDSCNLRCDYCFNSEKSGRAIKVSDAIRHLENLFSLFPNGEKYIVDLSGKGEPLIVLKPIVQIARWCHQKQDKIQKEVLVQFVSNGTLLSPAIAKVLQAEGILFGVSLDGNKTTHDKHRKTKKGSPTFDCILNNLHSIKNRDYVGCASTITRDVFPLLETVKDLLKTFKTISFRPVRGSMRINEESSVAWQKEYERLTKALFEDSLQNDDSMFLALMNGDDYFGRFLCRAFGGQITINRCDGGIARFSVDNDGTIYPCSAAVKTELIIAKDPRESSDAMIRKQSLSCENCPFKFHCGGECLVELSYLGGPSSPMCELKKKMIVLANWLERKILAENYPFHEKISNFVEEKMKRFSKNEELHLFIKEHPEMSFTTAKRVFDQINKKY